MFFMCGVCTNNAIHRYGRRIITHKACWWQKSKKLQFGYSTKCVPFLSPGLYIYIIMHEKYFKNTYYYKAKSTTILTAKLSCKF